MQPSEPTTPAIQTVLGAVAADTIDTADAHAHLWIDPPDEIPAEERIELRDFEPIRNELAEFAAPDVTLAVDCQPGGTGRNVAMLMKLSQECGIHITATTGYHLRKYYAEGDWLWSASAEEAATYFIEELTTGILEVDEPVQATTIKVGYTGSIEGQEQTLMEAAAEAARITGAVVLFHTEAGKNVKALLPFFSERGVPPTQLYLCHVDKRPDHGLHRELAQAGVLLGYDTFARPKYQPEANLWPLLLDMVSAGYAGQIAIGLDMAFASMWQYGGGRGMAMIRETIIPRLRTEGVDEQSIRGLTGGNIARFLVRRT